MPKQDRKSKMISLRLTAGEYAALHALYPSYGARNVSDLARLALQQVMGNSLTSDTVLSTKVHNLDERLNVVELQVSLLLERQSVTG